MTQGLRTIAWFLGIAVTTGTGCAADLATDLRALVGRSPDVGVQIIDCTTGASVFSHNADKRFTPASNLKVFTTAAALELVGADYEFRTGLLALTEGTKTTLTLVGSGDPALFDQELILPDNAHGNWTTVAAACDAWAASLRHAGLEQIDEFVLDARIFDSEPIPSGDKKWLDNRTAGTYASGVWGFNLAGNAATLSFNWAPGARPTIANSEPPIAWRVVSNTASCGKAGDFGVGYGEATGELRLSGSLPRATDTAPVAILHPLPLAAEMFARELSRRGIAISKCRPAVPSDRKPDGREIGPILTTRIQTVLRGANTYSKNICADALVKFLGAYRLNPTRPPIGPSFQPGTFAAGEAALKDFVERRLGAGCSGPLCARDGSGLSADNKVTADLTARLIAVMAKDDLCPNYLSSFAVPKRASVSRSQLSLFRGTWVDDPSTESDPPIVESREFRAGEREALAGTMGKRFEGANLDGFGVYCKSGYIDGASCLSGMVLDLDKDTPPRPISFSVLCCTGTPRGLDVAAAKQLQQRIVEKIVAHMRTLRTQHTPIASGH